MGTIKVKLPDDLEKKLRDIVPAKKGALSEFITEAIREKLEKMERGGIKKENESG